MNKTRKSVAITLVLMILISLVQLGSTAAPARFEIQNMAVSMGGQPLLDVTQGELDVVLTVENMGAEATPLILLMLCEGDEDYYQVRKTVYTDQISFGQADRKQLPLSITCDRQGSNLFLKAVIYDGTATLNCLSNEVCFPSEADLQLSSLAVNGSPVDGFDRNIFAYDFMLAEGENLPVQITGEKVNGAAQMAVTYPDSLPGDATVTLSSPAGRSVVYTLHLRAFAPEVKVTYYGGGNPEDIVLVPDFQVGVKRYSDDDSQGGVAWQEPIPAEMLGGTYLQTRWGDNALPEFKSNEKKDWLNFTINQSADVYYITWTKNYGGSYQGFVDDLIKEGYQWMTNPDGSDLMIKTQAKNGRWGNGYLLKKRYTVAPGETATISYKTGGSNYETSMYSALVKFVDRAEEEAQKLSALSVNGTPLEDFSKDVFDYELTLPLGASLPVEVAYETVSGDATVEVTQPAALPGDLTIKVSNAAGNFKTYVVHLKEMGPEVKVTYYGGGNPEDIVLIPDFQAGVKRFSDDDTRGGAKWQEPLPAELLGGTYLQTRWGDNALETFKSNERKDWLNFTINQTADVYYITWTKNYGGSYQGFVDGLLKEGYAWVTNPDGSDLMIKTDVANGKWGNGYLLKKRYVVAPGETATISYKTGGSNYDTSMYSALVKFVEEPQSAVIRETQPQQGVLEHLFRPAAKAAEDGVTVAKAAVENGEFIVEGTAAGAPISLFVTWLQGQEETLLPQNLIYAGTAAPDANGAYRIAFPMYETRGNFRWFVTTNETDTVLTGTLTYDPSTDSGMKSFRIGGAAGIISGTQIHVQLTDNSDIRGLVPVFEIADKAKCFVGDKEQVSGQTKNNFSTPVYYRVVAEDQSETVYTVMVTPKQPGGGTGGGGGGSTGSRPSGGSGPVEITTPEPTQKPTIEKTSFEDVPTDFWAYEEIERLVELGIVSGYEDGSFFPENAITREEFIKIVVNAFYLTPGETSVAFDDVPQGEWYSYYIDIAASAGVIQGVGANVFGVGQAISRQDAAVILHRVIQHKGLNPAQQAEKIEFADKAAIASYAGDAVVYLQQRGILSGYEDQSFRPENDVSRAEVCAIVCRLLESTSN